MKINFKRSVLMASLAIVILTILSEMAGSAIVANPDVQALLNRIGLIKLLAAVLIMVAALFLLEHWRLESLPLAGGTPDGTIDSLAEEFFQSLKAQYIMRYKSKLDGRLGIHVEATSDVVANTFAPGSGITLTTGSAIDLIPDAFEKTGRLLIAGDPGVGKTVLLHRFAIDLLNSTRDPSRGPFPVIFNLASWSYDNFEDWLTATLVSKYDLSEAFAKRLLKEERIILLLDGLDEVATNEWWERDSLLTYQKRQTEELFDLESTSIRVQFLAFLNNYLRGGIKVVVCCRVQELAGIIAANCEIPVAATIKILNLTNQQVSAALSSALDDKDIRHHAAARNLLRMVQMEGNDALLDVLSTPFYFTLAMDIFDREVIKQRNLPKTARDIEGHLLSEFVKRTLVNNAKSQREAGNSIKWLAWLAKLLERRQFATFEMTDLQLGDLANKWQYQFWSRLMIGLLFLFVAGLVGGWWFGLSFALLGAVFIGGADVEDFIDFGSESRFDFSKLLSGGYWTAIFKTIFEVVLVCLGVLFAFSITLLRFVPDKYKVSTVSIVFFLMLYYGLSVTLWASLFLLQGFRGIAHNKHPYGKMFAGFRRNLTFACLIFLVLFAFTIWLKGIVAIDNSFSGKLVIILAILVPSVLVTETRLIKHFVLRLCVRLTDSLPFRYAAFLDHAVSLRILEREGSRWRFRHRNIQEYFAARS